MNRHCALVLHAHVPWVRHPETDRCLEEDWVFESLIESYLPLLEVLHRLRDEDVPWRLTLNLSPTLMGLLSDPMMQKRADAYFKRTIELAASERKATNDPAYRRVAQWYEDRLARLQKAYETRWNRDIIGAFRSLADSGHLEIVACGATHGLLPLLCKVPEAARAQISAGIHEYEEAFGKAPSGFWLPECAYSPAIAPMLRDAGIRWTMLEEHGLTSANHSSDSSPFHPARAAGGLAVFGRDAESSRQVWSSDFGYPGDPRYREFYRDVGLDAPAEALEDYLDGSGIRRFTGLKFYRITGATDEKLLYDPALAARAVAEDAVHFVESRAAQLATLENKGIDQPIVVSAFDAELFGHWWFEGPDFLEQVLRLAANRDDFHFTTPTAYLDETEGKVLDNFEPIASSWGEGGYFETWLSEENAWIYPHLHTRAEQLLRAIAILQENLDDLPPAHAEHRMRTVAQMTRELMLAQASDWAFLMRNGAARPYATKQTEDRIDCFDELWGVFGSSPEAASERLAAIEARTPIFPDLPWDLFGKMVDATLFVPDPEPEGEEAENGPEQANDYQNLVNDDPNLVDDDAPNADDDASNVDDDAPDADDDVSSADDDASDADDDASNADDDASNADDDVSSADDDASDADDDASDADDDASDADDDASDADDDDSDVDDDASDADEDDSDADEDDSDEGGEPETEKPETEEPA